MLVWAPMSVRVGVAGVAGMGLMHLVTAPKIEGYEVTAICDNFPRALENASGLAPGAATFDDLGAMCSSGAIDAVDPRDAERAARRQRAVKHWTPDSTSTARSRSASRSASAARSPS